MKPLTIVITGILLLINLLSFFLMRADKQRAKHNRRRIPEKTLFLSAALFGASPPEEARAGGRRVTNSSHPPRLEGYIWTKSFPPRSANPAGIGEDPGSRSPSRQASRRMARNSAPSSASGG